MDVPRAAVCVVENAEMFGLSQLHQIRGRLGRTDRGKQGRATSPGTDPAVRAENGPHLARASHVLAGGVVSVL